MNNINLNFNQMNSTLSQRGFQFQKGFIFLGSIKQILPNDLAVLQVGNKEYTAKLDIALRIGQSYWFLIENISESGIPYITTINNKYQKDPYQQLIEKLRLPKDRITRQLLSKLTQNHMLIDYTKLPNMINLLKQIETPDIKTGINTIFHMVQHNLPLEKGVFESLFGFFTSRSISTQLDDLYNMLSKQSSGNEAIQKVMMWVENFKQLESFSLSKLISILGIDYEKILAQSFDKNMLHKQDFYQLKPILIELLNEDLNSTVNDKVKKILAWLTGQQLVNLVGNDLSITYMFHTPFFIKEDQIELWVMIQGYRNSSGILNPENNRLLFYLSLSNIGETVVELNVQKKIVTVKVLNENDLSALIPILSPYLNERLDANGFHLSSVLAKKLANVQKYFFTTVSKDMEIKVDLKV
jgi:hypothetical protein